MEDFDPYPPFAKRSKEVNRYSEETEDTLMRSEMHVPSTDDSYGHESVQASQLTLNIDVGVPAGLVGRHDAASECLTHEMLPRPSQLMGRRRRDQIFNKHAANVLQHIGDLQTRQRHINELKEDRWWGATATETRVPQQFKEIRNEQHLGPTADVRLNAVLFDINVKALTRLPLSRHMMIIPVRASVCKVKVFVCVLLCTCVTVTFIQWTHVWMLRAEITEIKHRFRPRDTRDCASGCACCGVSGYDRFSERKTPKDNRDKRDVTELKKQRQKRNKHHTFLHLVPVSSRSCNEDDITVLSWAVGQSRGNALQVSGDTVTVVTEGTYFIYSQVLYKHNTLVMGHVITKKFKGAESKLMKCLKSTPSNVSHPPSNTCYTAGIHFLESGSTLQLAVPRRSAELILTAHATFMGILNI
ncbi:tumor necrosis factor ligand superfamily member 13 isoform X2 [Triplophysa dalaica]|uniref:tumor necrosis factor ligand superfamily member 13 isoform X2 n=1 Tax=Triplophysa dalaica TaxID=1582913 RepID=UPI0024E01037|nr:tumor necrosis factor ligand superfamily member 13 isoform X2 [Triplophysa dalaica]